MEAARGSPPNGVTWRWVVGVLLAVLGGLSMGVGGYLRGEIAHTRARVDEHVELPGHPVVIERVDMMRHDIDQIKVQQRVIGEGVNELLRRIPPK